MHSRKVFKNILFTILLQAVLIIVGFVVPKLLLENYGSNVYGLVSSITKFLAYISLLEAGFGVVVKAVLYKPIAKKDKKSIAHILKSSEMFFRRISLIFIIYIVGLCFIYPLLVLKEFSTFFTISLILIIAISNFFEYFFGMTYTLYLQAEEKHYITAGIKILTYLLYVIVISIAIYLKASIEVVELCTSIVFILRPIIQNIYVKKKYNIVLKNVQDNNSIKNKWDGFVQHLAAVINESSDIILLTIFGTTIDVSIYSVYFLVVGSLKTIVNSLMHSVEATFGNMIAKSQNYALNKSFKTYELFYFSLLTIIFSCTIVLLVPFVSTYTSDITDANYINYLFGYLIALAYFIYCIRSPYYSLIMASGHIKETKIPALIEVMLNVSFSIIGVLKYGIVGVAIGSLIAMTYRTLQIAFYANKTILCRAPIVIIKRFIIMTIQTFLVFIIYQLFPKVVFTDYIMWVKYAIITFGVSLVIVLGSNILLYKEDRINFVKIVKRIIN